MRKAFILTVATMLLFGATSVSAEALTAEAIRDDVALFKQASVSQQRKAIEQNIERAIRNLETATEYITLYEEILQGNDYGFAFKSVVYKSKVVTLMYPVVTGVYTGGPFHEQLKPGDRIVSVNRNSVSALPKFETRDDGSTIIKVLPFIRTFHEILNEQSFTFLTAHRTIYEKDGKTVKEVIGVKCFAMLRSYSDYARFEFGLQKTKWDEFYAKYHTLLITEAKQFELPDSMLLTAFLEIDERNRLIVRNFKNVSGFFSAMQATDMKMREKEGDAQ